MSTPVNEQVFDLDKAYLYLKSSFVKMGDRFYDLILYVKKNAIVVGLIVALGVAYGWYQDSQDDSYSNELILKPNFGSADYLYGKIALLQSKIKQKDSVFLQKLGFIEYDKITKIDLEPIVDPYRFMSSSEKNSNYFRVLINDADLETVIKSETNQTLFLLHKLTFITDGKVIDKETVAPLLSFLNASEFYKKQTELELAANQDIIKGIDSTIHQIDLTLAKTINNETSPAGKMIYFDGKEKADNIFEQKSELLVQKAKYLAEINALDKTIKEISRVTNLKEEVKIYQKKKITTPFFFLFLFTIFINFKGFLINQKTKRQ